MADEFNPYHVWLGIPLKDQPANHYRLLSIDLFETSGDVIDNAADRQMAHLRTIQVGKHGELSQRLLNEVAAARVCLLDPKKRAAYDQQLRAKLPATPAASAPAAASRSSIQRQPPRRPGPLPTAAPTPAPSMPVATALPQPVNDWDDLLGDPTAKPASRSAGKSPGANSAKAGAAKRAAKNRNMSIGIAAAVLLIAGAGIGWLALNGSSSEGTLVFDWPADEKADATVTVDDVPLPAPASGAWEYHGPAGSHHIVALRPAYKIDANVALAAGQRQTAPADWKPKAVLALSWPLSQRAGAELKIDGRTHAATQHDPLEIAVEPGLHVVQITRPGSAPLVRSATIASEGHALVAIAPPPPSATKLVFDWPADQRKDTELIIDGSKQTVPSDSDSASFALVVAPGRRVVHITRTGFEPFNKVVDLAAGANETVEPAWTPVQTVATPPADTQPLAETSVEQPAKKLPVPPAAEQEKITKQLDDLYKSSHSGSKDPAKAQELFDLAAKAGASPAERYVLLVKGAEIAAAAGDLNLSLQGVDSLDTEFEIDALEAKQKLLDKFVSAGKAEQVDAAVPIAEQLMDQAVAADRYPLAIEYSMIASRAATKSKSPTRKEIDERLSRRRHEIHVLEPVFAAATTAQETLAKNPADAEANSSLGRWLCFYKNDWSAGLPLLAKGSDDKLKSLAEQELKSPTDAEQQAHLADAWWDLASKESGIARDSIHLHAGEIYQTAMPNLTSALRKAAIEKRLAEIADVGPTPTPVVATSSVGRLHYAVNEYSWKLGQPNVQLMQKSRGFCFLSSVSGHFGGFGEGVGVHLANDGFWSLDGHAKTDSLSAKALSIEHLTPVLFKSRVTEYHWKNGEPPVKMLHKKNGICFLSAIAGHFEGGGEEVSVRLGDDGFWYLGGRSGQDQLGASALGLEWAKPGAWSIQAEEHKWSVGDSPIKLLEKRQGFAFLSSVSGHFWGGGEEVRVYLGGDDVWYLAGKSGQPGLRGSATAIYVSTEAAGHAMAGASVAESLTPRADVGTPAAGREFDLLAKVDTNRDSIEGHWERNGSFITCNDSTSGGDRRFLEFPTEITEGRYELRVEFSRDSGEDCIAVSFPVGERSADLVLSDVRGKFSGLEKIDGHSLDDPANPTARSPSTLENGKRYVVRIMVSVQRDTVKVNCFLDGDELAAWKGNVDSLDQNKPWKTDPHRVGIGEWNSPSTIYGATVRALK